MPCRLPAQAHGFHRAVGADRKHQRHGCLADARSARFVRETCIDERGQLGWREAIFRDLLCRRGLPFGRAAFRLRICGGRSEQEKEKHEP
jgi:hypothetical protein